MSRFHSVCCWKLVSYTISDSISRPMARHDGTHFISSLLCRNCTLLQSRLLWAVHLWAVTAFRRSAESVFCLYEAFWAEFQMPRAHCRQACKAIIGLIALGFSTGTFLLSQNENVHVHCLLSFLFLFFFFGSIKFPNTAIRPTYRAVR